MQDNTKPTWLFITAGLTAGSLRDAGNRVAQQSVALFPFAKTVVITGDNLKEICPKTYRTYSKFLDETIKGYGYYAWKAEAVSNALEGKMGACNGVVWVDGGCEINANLLSKRIFNLILKLARRHGGWFYELETPERDYTKRDLIDRFKEAVDSRPSTQVQANFFVLQGEAGRILARKWMDLTLERVENVDFSMSSDGEAENFIEHRNDQSLFSILVKNMKFPISRFVPTSRPNSLIGFGKSFISPVWIARNRSGKSILPRRGKQIG